MEFNKSKVRYYSLTYANESTCRQKGGLLHRYLLPHPSLVHLNLQLFLTTKNVQTI